MATTLLTRPWEAVELVASYDRLSYLVALLLPLLLLPLAAPLLLMGALPEILINILADWFPQYSIQFQYVAVIVPFAVAASILGLARLRRATRPAPLVRLLADPRRVVAVWVGAVAISGVYLGPLPWWSDGAGRRIQRARRAVPGDRPLPGDGARRRADARRRARLGRQPPRPPTSRSASASTPSR